MLLPIQNILFCFEQWNKAYDLGERQHIKQGIINNKFSIT